MATPESEYEALKGEIVEFETTDTEGTRASRIMGRVVDVWFWHHSDPAFDIEIFGTHGKPVTIRLINGDYSWSYEVVG